MNAEILHWPWPLEGRNDWSQGLWRAQVDGRVVEFQATKPCADWPVARAALLEQLQTALAAGAVTVIEGPPITPEPLAPQPAPGQQASPTAAGSVLAVPRSATRLGLVPSGRHDEAHRHRQAVFQQLSSDGRLLFVDDVSSAAPGRHDLVVAPQWREQLQRLAMQPGDRLALVLDERQHPPYVIRLFPLGQPLLPTPTSKEPAERVADSRRIRQAAQAIVREQEADEKARQQAQAPPIEQMSLF